MRVTMSLLLAWAKATTLRSLLPHLTELVEAMTSERYLQLCDDAGRLLVFQQFHGKPSGQALPADRVGALSARMFKLVDQRFSDRESRERYRLAGYGSAQQDWPVLMLMLQRELELIGTYQESSAWDRALALMRRSVQIEAPDFYLTSRARVKMPKQVARQIVRSAELYPLSAIESAENRLAHLALPKTPPVGRVAKQQGWFEEAP